MRASLFLLAWLPLACQAPAEAPAAPTGTEVGQRAPELKGLRPDRSHFGLDARGSAHTVLIFYRSTRCGLCRFQLEQVQRHLAAYNQQDTRIIGATLDSSEANQALLEQMQLDFELVSVTPALFDIWAVPGAADGAPLPATYLLDRDGIVRFRHIGRNAADRTTAAELLTIIHGMTVP